MGGGGLYGCCCGDFFCLLLLRLNLTGQWLARMFRPNVLRLDKGCRLCVAIMCVCSSRRIYKSIAICVFFVLF